MANDVALPRQTLPRYLDLLELIFLARQLTWAEEPVQLFHYRDRDRVEVDMVLEHTSGTVIGIDLQAP